jgi:SAM-dependent methyltransferase
MSSDSQARKRAAIETHSQQAEEFAASYAGLEGARYRDCFSYSRHRLRAALERHLPARGDGLRLLDIGCGTGHHMVELRARGFEVAGMDAAAEMLVHARRNNPGADIRAADVEALPFAEAQFDVAISIEVLRYLPSCEPAIREAFRVLKPGGTYLVTAAPLLNVNGYALVNRLAPWLPIPSLVRLRQYFHTSWELRNALARAGFRAVDIHGVYGGPINWIERLAPRLLPWTLRNWEPIDRRLADLPVLRELSNMFLVAARK